MVNYCIVSAIIYLAVFRAASDLWIQREGLVHRSTCKRIVVSQTSLFTSFKAKILACIATTFLGLERNTLVVLWQELHGKRRDGAGASGELECKTSEYPIRNMCCFLETFHFLNLSVSCFSVSCYPELRKASTLWTLLVACLLYIFSLFHSEACCYFLSFFVFYFSVCTSKRSSMFSFWNERLQ